MSLIATRTGAIALALFPALLLVAFFSYGPGAEMYGDFIAYVVAKQREFHSGMKAALSAIADNSGISAAWALVFGSFLYGVFHAAGPGHGKVILSTYLMTQPETVRRSLFLAVASALMQGFVAIFLVYGLFYLFDLAASQSTLAVQWSERLSYALVIAIGGWLVWRAFRGFRSLSAAEAGGAPHDHDHGHGHHHHHDEHAHHGHDHHDHHHAHHHHAHHHHAHHHHAHHHHDHAHGEVCSTCGHAHVPNAEQVAQASDLKSALGVIFSIGLRPCSGAVLVLVFARFNGIEWAGMLAVLAISLGTALTVSLVALLAQKMRDFAMGLSQRSGQSLAWAAHSLTALGGIAFLAFGYGLLIASFGETARRGMGL